MGMRRAKKGEQQQQVEEAAVDTAESGLKIGERTTTSEVMTIEQWQVREEEHSRQVRTIMENNGNLEREIGRLSTELQKLKKEMSDELATMKEQVERVMQDQATAARATEERPGEEAHESINVEQKNEEKTKEPAYSEGTYSTLTKGSTLIAPEISKPDALSAREYEYEMR